MKPICYYVNYFVTKRPKVKILKIIYLYLNNRFRSIMKVVGNQDLKSRGKRG